VNLLTFWLFFAVNTPTTWRGSSSACAASRRRRSDKWKAEHGYDKPMLYNGAAQGFGRVTDTIFYEKIGAPLRLRFRQCRRRPLHPQTRS